MAIISMDRMGNVSFLDEYENEITDYYELQEVKKYTNWKEIVYNQPLNLIEEIDKNIEEARNFYLKTEKLITEDEIHAKIAEIKLGECIIPEYTGLSEQTLESKAHALAFDEAVKNISGFLPWKVKSERQKYVDEHISEILEKLKNEEKAKESQYYENAEKIKQIMNVQYKADYDRQKAELEKFIVNDDEKIIQQLKEFIKPENNDRFIRGESFAGSIGIFFNPDNSWIVFLGLPDISVVENRTAKMLSSGKVSVKNRNSKEIIADYHLICAGMILVAASKVFNINTNISEIKIHSIYSLIDESTGQDTTCVYENTFFTRQEFENLNISALNPVKTIERFHTDILFEDENQSEESESTKIYSLNDSENHLFDTDSISVVVSCLSQITEKFDTSIFYKENLKKLVSVCKDFCPNSDVEVDFIKALCEEGLLEELARKELSSDFFKRFLSIGNTFCDEEDLETFVIKGEQIFKTPLQDLFKNIRTNESKLVHVRERKISLGEENALQSAMAYLNNGSGFSKKELEEQLEYEGYSEGEVLYALNNCNADWSEQALTKMNGYLNNGSGFSKKGLIEQLEFNKFSENEIEFALRNCNVDWNQQASISAQCFLNSQSFSKKALLEQLLFNGFSQSEAEYGVKFVGY